MDHSHSTHCCAECGIAGGASLKVCKSCMSVKYCNAACQRNHWATHKKICKQRAAELHDEALFKDPPAKEDCPICFLPMPEKLVCCKSLPPATIMSVPIFDFAQANEELASKATKEYYSCCGKSICGGCIHSFVKSGNIGKCPFCNSERMGKTNEEHIEELMKRVEANDAGAIFMLGNHYYHGIVGLQQDQERAIDLWKQAAELGSSKAHYELGCSYDEGGDLKKAKFHYEAAAMAGHDAARYNIGCMEYKLGNKERAVKHWTIAASAGNDQAINNLIFAFNQGLINRDTIDSTLTAYNKSCTEMRSDARDGAIRLYAARISARW
jgi:tetratricopeptide (TPR) repeat protein